MSKSESIANEVASETSRFIELLLQHDDRSAVLLGAAKLDAELEKLLKGSFRVSPTKQDLLFDNDRPLGTFSAKIVICHRIGVIDDTVEHCLQMIRKIRNDFAHSIEYESLSHEKQRNRVVDALRLIADSKSLTWDTAEQIFAQQHYAEMSVELRDFLKLLNLLLIPIQIEVQLVRQLEPRRSVTFID